MDNPNKGTGQTLQTPPKSNWFDALHIIVYVLAVLAVGLIGFNVNRYLKEQNKNLAEQVPVNQNSNSATVDWKTYTNPFGYSIQYPKDWQTYDSTQGAGYAVSEYNIVKKQTSVETPPIGLQIYIPKPDRMVALTGYSKVKMGNIDAYKKDVGLNTGYIIPNGNSQVGINVYRGSDSDNSIINQILSTFKFTK